MNLQRREEIRAIAAEFRRLFLHEQAEAIEDLLAHIDTLEQAAAERVIADGSRGPTQDYTGEGSAWAPPVEARDAVVPENLLHDLAVAAWDEGADAGMVWDPDADPAKRGVVPCTPGEGIAKARDHFAKHGSGSPSSAFSRALQAIREHSRTIPANRVLGDGMVAVSLRAVADACERLEHLTNWLRGATDIPSINLEGDTEHVVDALRANQGGAAT